MAEFKIRLSTEIDEGKSTSQLESLKSKLEKSPIKLKVDFGNLSKQIKDINSAMKSAFRMDNKQLSNLKALKTTLQEINKLSKQTSNKLFGGDSGATQETKQLNTLIKKYDQLMSKKQSIEKQLSNIKVGNLTSSQAKEIDKLKASLKSLESFKIDAKDLTKSTNELSQLENKLKEVKSNLGNLNINMNIDKQLNTAKTSVDGLITKLQALGKTGFGDTNKINETVSKVQTLKNELSNLNPNSENFTSEFQRISESINQCENEYKQLNSAMQQSKSQFKFETNLNRTLSDLQQLRQRCIDLGQSTSQVDALEQQLKELGNVSTDKATTGLQRIKSEMATMKSSMSGLGTTTTGVQKTFSNLYSTMTTFSLGNILAQQIQKGVYSIGTTITELDSAFRDLMKVAPTDFTGTTKQLDELRNKSVEVGKSVARSSVDIINSTSSALQLGIKNIDEAMDYAKNVNLFANVSDQSEEDADTQLKGILSAYGGINNALKSNQNIVKGATSDYNQMINIMDMLNYAGNNFAVTSGDMSTAMSKFASVASASGIEAYQAISYAVGTNETLQDAGKTGNALKTILTNLNGLKTSAKDGSIGLNKTAKALKSIADIDVLDSNGQVKDMNDILGELGEKYKTLDKNGRLAIGESIGGKTQINAVQALLGNWDQVIAYQEQYNKGMMVGSSEKENQRYIDSIEGRVVKLKEELKKLVTTTISTDMFKGMVSGLTGVFSTINNVISAFDKLGVATPVVLSGLTGVFMAIKSFGTGTQLPNFAKTIGGLVTSTSGLNTVKDSLKNTSTQFTTLTAGATKYSGSLRVVSSSSEKFNNSIRNNGVVATKSANGLTLMSKTASQAKSSLSGMSSALQGIGSTLLTTFGNMAIMAVAGMAISKITQELYEFANASEISMQKHEENINKINTKISELNSEKSGLKSIAKEYDELAKKTNKTTEETERYNELRNQIAELSPDLVVGTDSDNNAILSLNGSLKDYIENLDSAVKKQKELLMQQQNAMASDASDHLQKGGNVAFGYDYKNYEKATKVAEEEKSKIEKSGTEVINSINRFTAVSENAFDSSIERIQAARENHTQQIEDSYNKVIEEQEKINEYSSKLKQKALNKVESNTKIEKAGEDIKSFAKNVTSSLDFSSLKTGQIDTFARNLSNALGDDKIDGILLKYQSLREELERTGDTFTYEDSVKSLIPEMSDLLGLNEEIVSSMLKLDPTLTQATSSLDAYLQSFGKRESMREFDVETENLAKQYETFSTMMDDLGNLDASKDGNGEVRFELSAVAEIVNQEDVPKQVQDLFSKMQQDGQFTDEEMEVMMRISAGMTTEDSGQRKELLDQAQQLIDELFPDNEIDIGELGIKAELNFDATKFNKDLGGILKGEKNQQIRIDIETAVQFGDVKTLQDKLKQLPEKKQVEIINSIQQAGGMTPEQLKELINGLPDEVKKQIKVSTPGADESNSKLEKVDANSKSKNKQVKTSAPGADETISKEKQVDKNSGNKKKVVTTTNPGGMTAAQTLAQINSRTYDKKQTITTVFKTIGKAVTNFFGGGYQPPVIKNTGGFSNISDTPQEISAPTQASKPTAMSTGFSNVSNTPTDAGVSSSTPTSGASGMVSAKSNNPITSVFTAPSKSTKIVTSYKNIWNAIKYGVNLFQELENRITKVSNNISLLDAKMENAVGTKKISYLQQQNKLYKEQASLTNTLYKSLEREKSTLVGKVKSYGFTVNKQGNLTSYEETLTKLEKAAEAAEKKSSNYSGKSDKTKKSLEKSADKAKQKLEEVTNSYK